MVGGGERLRVLTVLRFGSAGVLHIASLVVFLLLHGHWKRLRDFDLGD